jgi:hypothetical protein
LAISNGEVILIVVLAAIPVAAVTFALGAGRALDRVGKGQFSIEFDRDLSQGPGDGGGAERQAELRQMLEAKAYRQSERGEDPLDVDSELQRLLADEAAPAVDSDAALAEEVRQLVVAGNERRVRQGKAPLDVEAEVRRRLHELESLGQ